MSEYCKQLSQLYYSASLVAKLFLGKECSRIAFGWRLVVRKPTVDLRSVNVSNWSTDRLMAAILNSQLEVGTEP